MAARTAGIIGMSKLRHCHPMYSAYNITAVHTVCILSHSASFLHFFFVVSWELGPAEVQRAESLNHT